LSNLRWVNYSQNGANRYGHVRKGSKRSSVFKGVNWDPARQKWIARLCVDWKTQYLGGFDEEADAAKAYDDALKLAHPIVGLTNECIAQQRREQASTESGSGIDVGIVVHKKRVSKPRSSRFPGVSFCKRNGKWLSSFRMDGRSHYIGYFAEEQVAAEAREQWLMAREDRRLVVSMAE
jgi:hypothetical protein